jgi:serine protease Do
VIRQTLANTQSATFCVELPNAQKHKMPTPTGTGFFISPDGWFVTAAHVITENGASDGPIRTDLSQTWLMKETRVASGLPGAMCQSVSFGHVIPHLDFALLKIDFAANSNKAWMKGNSGFPFLQVSQRQLGEGESVYAFGYPL